MKIDRLRFHDLRHTAASLLIAQGARLEEVKDVRSGLQRIPMGTSTWMPNAKWFPRWMVFWDRIPTWWPPPPQSHTSS